MPESGVTISIDDDAIRATYPDGATQRLRWEDVERVVIETNDSGPWGVDVWWLLEGRDGRCAYPQGATGEEGAMNAYRERLEGFDWEAMIRAQGSTDNAKFLCWERGTSE